VPALLLLGTLLVQAAWILTLPPFRGTDEFDHAYRAASVARGEWRAPTEAAQDGRGLLVTVPRDLVAAASPVCSSYLYTGHDNCYPAADAGHGNVRVATAAGNYNPAFYWVIGTVARPLDGAHALYAMRIAAALLCAAFVAVAGWVTAQWARTAWPLLALVVATTPVMFFSLSVAAPNGLEMAVALSLWMSLLGIVRTREDDPVRTRLLWVALVSGVVLAPLRLLGPLWLALTGLTFLLALGLRPFGRLVRRHRVLAPALIGAWTVSAAVAVWWTRSAGVGSVEAAPVSESGAPVGTDVSVLGQVPLWFFQGVAAFPRRMDSAPAVVYVTVGVVLLGLIGVGLAAATARLRVAIVAVLAVAVLVPIGVTASTISVGGPLWQGRYGLPFHMGVVLLAGLALELRPHRHRLTPLLLSVAAVCLVVGQVVSPVRVLRTELATSPLRDSALWVRPSVWLVGLLVLAGLACLACALACWRRTSTAAGAPGG
jgi:hypothetical protein